MKFKKVAFTVLSLIAVTFALTACNNQEKPEAEEKQSPEVPQITNTEVIVSPAPEIVEDFTTEEESFVQIANPVVEYDNIEDAVAVVGHLSTLPNIYERYSKKVSVINNDLLQIVYFDDEGDILTLREEVGDADDISGNYNKYAYTSSFESNGNIVIIKGDSENSIHLAIWNDGTYAHSLDYEKGVFLEEVTAAVNDIQ